MLICGIDPGKTGAIAFVDTPGVLRAVVPMPVETPASRFKRRKLSWEINWWAVTEAIRAEKPDLVVLERQGARPGQGVSSTFVIGFQYGALTGVLAALGLPFEVVDPSVWKRGLDLLGHDKNASRERAIELMPESSALFSRKKDHGRAEAALIALWKVKHGTAGALR
jgi:crossover junction endodeoxyribonuclease RuvC